MDPIGIGFILMSVFGFCYSAAHYRRVVGEFNFGIYLLWQLGFVKQIPTKAQLAKKRAKLAKQRVPAVATAPARPVIPQPPVRQPPPPAEVAANANDVDQFWRELRRNYYA